MKIIAYPVGGEKATLCWIVVTQKEALAIIKSLAAQALSGDSNTERLESHCTGEFSEMSIVVHAE